MNISDLILKYKVASSSPCDIAFKVDNIIVLVVFPVGNYPTMYIPKDDVERLVKGVSSKLLESEPGFIDGFCMIGKVYPGMTCFDAKVIGEELLNFILKADKKLNDLINGYIDKSETFSNFLIKTMNYQGCKNDTENVMSLEYFWLIGEIKQNKNFVPLPVFEKKYGVVIDPENKQLPIYTNSLFAQIAAYNYKERYGYDLNLYKIPCLGCFLSGLGQTAGRKVADITYLNNQWKISYHVSDQGNYKTPNHFSIYDEETMNNFFLVGCKEQGKSPVWIEYEEARRRKFIVNNLMAWGANDARCN
ncbi:MAG: hypothetical protein EOM59_09320 [Clostridia bacterium]|nr:hypothetical protein [Clostridia bacterium]